jgi:chromosome segregation ATPase
LSINEEHCQDLYNLSKTNLNKIDELTKKLNTENSKRKIIENELSESQNDNNTAKNEITELKLELINLNKKYCEKEDQCLQSNQFFIKLESELEKKKVSEKKLTENEERFKNEISLKEGKLVLLTNENKKHEKDFIQLKKEIESLKKVINTHENEDVKKSKTIDDLNSKLAEFDLNTNKSIIGPSKVKKIAFFQ